MKYYILYIPITKIDISSCSSNLLLLFQYKIKHINYVVLEKITHGLLELFSATC